MVAVIWKYQCIFKHQKISQLLPNRTPQFLHEGKKTYELFSRGRNKVCFWCSITTVPFPQQDLLFQKFSLKNKIVVRERKSEQISERVCAQVLPAANSLQKCPCKPVASGEGGEDPGPGNSLQVSSVGNRERETAQLLFTGCSAAGSWSQGPEPRIERNCQA